jgi:hypothetical protein
MLPLARLLLATAAVFAVAKAAHAEQQKMNDADYTAKAMTAAPAAIAKDATILAMGEGGAMRTLRKGSNEFTCMILPDGTPMCTDPAGMEWMHALMSHTAPPDKVAFMYMLAGDSGASNTMPGATGPTPDNHWVKTGPHVMMMGPSVKAMTGYPRSADADPSQPYVMWAGTPYEHMMIPVK